MTGGSSSGTGAGGSGDGTVSHRKGHRRQESMYAMTGLYSETEGSDDAQRSSPTLVLANFCHDTVIKCHSRNPSAGFDR